MCGHVPTTTRPVPSKRRSLCIILYVRQLYFTLALFSLLVSPSPLLPFSFPLPPSSPLSYLSTLPLSLLPSLLRFVCYRSSPSPMSLVIYMRSATRPSRYVPHLYLTTLLLLFLFLCFYPLHRHHFIPLMSLL